MLCLSVMKCIICCAFEHEKHTFKFLYMSDTCGKIDSKADFFVSFSFLCPLYVNLVDVELMTVL